MKTFEVIEDTRFSTDAKENVIQWSESIYNDLKQSGAIVYKENVRELVFKDNEPCKSYRVRFYIDKYSNKPTFKDMQRIVNKTQAVCFDNVANKKLILTFAGLTHHIN